MPPTSSLSQSDRLEDWLQQHTPPHSSPSPVSRKRSNDSISAHMPRNPSPKRPRVEIDDVLPTQSASQVGTVSVLALSPRTTFTAPSVSKRSSSPSRALTELRTATPSICLSPLTQVKKTPPAAISTRINNLRRREGLETRYIPVGLREAIESDALFGPSLAMDPIDPEAYDHNDTRPADHPSLKETYHYVRKIFQYACRCTELGCDENAWCYRVILPLVELAISQYHESKFDIESVQSQNIQPLYLSTIEGAAFMRKTDFCFSYSCFKSPFEELYKDLAMAKVHTISHTTDNCTQRLGLFSGIEVKPENGDVKEAELQISVWMAASLRKKMELARIAFPTSGPDLTSNDVMHCSNNLPNKDATAVQPLHVLETSTIVIGNEHKVYYAYLSEVGGDVKVLGPDERLANIATRSLPGIFKVLEVYRRLLDNGLDTWTDFLGPVLGKLAERHG